MPHFLHMQYFHVLVQTGLLECLRRYFSPFTSASINYCSEKETRLLKKKLLTDTGTKGKAILTIIDNDTEILVKYNIFHTVCTIMLHSTIL